MSRPQFTHDMLRVMGYKNFAVWVLLLCARDEGINPVTRDWLVDHLPDRTSPNAVTVSLRWLCSDERQFALRVVGGWTANTDKAFQLPLEIGPGNSGSAGETFQKDSENLFDPTTTTLINDSSFIVSSSSRTFEKDSENLFRTILNANLAACKAVGIGEPVASELSALEHVTPELIHDHIADLGPGDTKGLAILRIRNNEPPASWERVSEDARATQGNFWLNSDPKPEPTWEERIAIPQSALDRAREGTCSECGFTGPCIGITGGNLCFDHYKQWRIETMGLEKLRPKVVKGADHV